MAIEPTDFEPVMPAPSGLTTGGNRNLVNGDEDDTPAASYERIGIRRAGGQLADDDAHVQGAYRKRGL